MAETIYAPWLEAQDPVEQMEEFGVRLLDAADEFITDELASDLQRWPAFWLEVVRGERFCCANFTAKLPL